MADEVVKGTNAFTLVNQDFDYKPETGYVLTQRWEGPRTLAATFADTLKTTGASNVRHSTGGGLGVVTCTISGNAANPSTGYDETTEAERNAVWECIGEVVEKRLEAHGKFDIVGENWPATVEAIEQAIKDGTAASRNFNTEFSATNANSYRDLRLKGVDSYREAAYRVRKTVTFSKEALIRVDFTKVGKVVTWADIAVDPSACFSQPSIHMALPYSTGAFADILVEEWLVEPPSVTWDRKLVKWTIVQEWLGAVNISAILYDGGTGTP